jgi:hypothetical protein
MVICIIALYASLLHLPMRFRTHKTSINNHSVVF